MADRLNSPMNMKKVSEEGLNTYTREGEEVFYIYKDIRDYVVITDERIIMVDIKGTGKKINIKSIPYGCICAWSYETKGVGDTNEEFLFELINGKEVIFGIVEPAEELYRTLCTLI